MYIGGYFGFAVGFSLLTVFRSMINLYFSIGASRKVRWRHVFKIIADLVSASYAAVPSPDYGFSLEPHARLAAIQGLNYNLK